MKQINLKQQLLLKKVKNIFQHPTGYISILHKEDHYLHVYDQKTMNITTSSNKGLHQHIKFITFTNNFNIFYASCQQQQKHTQRQERYNKIYKFQPDKEGKLICSKHCFYKGSIIMNIKLLGLTSIQQQNSQDNQYLLLGWNTTYYYHISQDGEVIKQNKFATSKKQFYIDFGQVFHSNILLAVCQNVILMIRVHLEYMQILSQITLTQKIIRFHLQKQSNSKYFIIITETSTYLATFNKLSFTNIYKIQKENISYKRICFLTPGVEVSSTNCYKNKIFLIFQTKNQKKPDERHTRQQMNRSSLRSSNNAIKNQQKQIYINQFTINNYDNKQNSIKILKAEKQFYFPYESNINDIFYNEHDQNYIRILTAQNNLMKINLFAIYQNPLIGSQWVNLGFKLIPISKVVHYEQTEDQFQQIKKKTNQKIQKCKYITQDQLNDWSFSLFNHEQLKQIKKKRIKIPFFD